MLGCFQQGSGLSYLLIQLLYETSCRGGLEVKGNDCIVESHEDYALGVPFIGILGKASSCIRELSK